MAWDTAFFATAPAPEDSESPHNRREPGAGEENTRMEDLVNWKEKQDSLDSSPSS